MGNQIACVLAETYGLRIYAIMLPPSDFSVAHSTHPEKHGETTNQSDLENVQIKALSNRLDNQTFPTTGIP